MTGIVRYLKLYFSIFGRSVSLLLVSRLSFGVWSVVHILGLLINFLFFNIIYLKAGTLGGWNIFEVVILLGYMELVMGLGGLTFYPMMYDFSQMIRKGDLDWKLMRPVDVQFLISFPWLDISDVLSIVSGIIVMGIGLYNLHPEFLAVNVIVFIFLLILSMTVLYSFVLLLLTLAFYTTRLVSVDSLYGSIQWLGRYPESIFKGVAHFIIMFVVPVGLVSSVPAQALVGVFNPLYIAYLAVLAIALFVISRKVFLGQIKNYSSASS